MLNELFQTVLGMSLTGAVVILLVLVARLILRGAPRVFSYALWAVVLFRLLCPFTLESALSLVPSARIVEVPGIADTSAEIVQVSTGIPAVDDGLNDYLAAHPYQGYVPAELPPDGPLPVIPQAGDISDWRTVPAALWLTGVGTLLAYSVISLVRLRRRLVGTAPLEGETGVWLADHIDTPFVLGLFRPKIYLPSALPEGEREYVLLHERAHIRRLDHATRALAWLALCLHWFNPLAWLAFHLAGKDMETSCDEAVLRSMDRDVRADYAASLLRLSAGKRLPVGPLAFGDSDPKGRIKNVLNYKKPAFWVTVIALIAVLAAGVLLFTGRPFPPAEEQPGGDTALPAGLSYSLNERGCVVVNGLRSGRAPVWLPPEAGDSDPLGVLMLDAPFFLDPYFEENPQPVSAAWTDESRTAVEVRFLSVSSDLNVLAALPCNFIADLSAGTVELTDWSGSYLVGETPHPYQFTDGEMLAMAQTLAEIVRGAEGFYAAQS